MQMMQGLQATALLKAGVDLGVFDHIDAGKKDAASVAAAAGTDERGMRILLDALAALGLLEADGVYALSPLADAFLVSSRPTYLGAFVNVISGDWAWAGYPRLAEAVRTGGTVLEEDADTPGLSFWETFARSSTGIAAPASQALAQVLEPWATSRDSLDVLDIACGSGLYSLTLARQHEHARLTLLDWPNVLAITRGTVEEMGLLERTSFIEGDVFDVPLGGPYDLIVASHIFHHFSKERCVALMRRLADALKPDGRLAINDFMTVDTTPQEEPFPRLFSVVMLVFTHEGEAYPLEAYEEMLREAGFNAPEVHEGHGMPSRFLIASPLSA
jgi:C-methyltransferase